MLDRETADCELNELPSDFAVGTFSVIVLSRKMHGETELQEGRRNQDSPKTFLSIEMEP
jgi:hypothetical protein